MSSDINVQTFSGKVNINNNLLVGSSHFFVDTVNNKVGITTASPDAGLHVNSNAYVNTDFRVGTSIVMNDTDGQITAGSFVGNGSGLSNVNSDSGLWTGAGTGNVYLSTSTHKVGIGTSEPTDLLHIMGVGPNSSGNFIGINISDNQGSNSSTNLPAIGFSHNGNVFRGGIQMIGTNTNLEKDMIFRVGRDTNIGGFSAHSLNDVPERMRINRNGNVGIGGRTVGLLAPLHVSIPGTLDYGGYTNTPLDMSQDMFRIGNRIANNPTYDHNEYGIQFGVSGSGNSSIQTYVYNHSTTSTTANYNLLLQPNGGNVGIGTTSPQTNLHVTDQTDTTGTGDAFISGLTTNASNRKPTECLRLQGKWYSPGSGALLRFTNQHPQGTFPNTGEYNLAGIAGYDHDNSWGGGLAFYTSPGSGSGGDNLTVRMIIDSLGNVGIGHTSPIAKLDIKDGNRTGTTPTHNMAFYVTTDVGSEGPGPEIRHSNQSQGIGFGYQSIYATGYNANQEIKIISRGSSNVYIKNYAVYSDDRIKTNEQYITNAMKTLLKLKPQIYDKHEKINEICDNPTREAGLIAQDVYYDAPELRYLISARNDGIDDGPVNIPEEKPFVDDDPTKDPDYSGWGNASAGIAYIQFVPYLIKAVQEIHEDLQTTRSQLEGDLQMTHSQLEEELQTTQTQIGDTQTQLQTTQTQLGDTQTQLGDTQTQLETTRTELEEELQTARTQLQNTRTELEITNLKLHNAEARIGTLEQTMTSILSKLNV